LILAAAATADADGADDLTVAPQGDAASEDHDPPMIGVLDSVELPARLAVLGELGGRNVECARRERLVDGDVDAASTELRTDFTLCAVETAPGMKCCPLQEHLSLLRCG
jgi:hypothetical protein